MVQAQIQNITLRFKTVSVYYIYFIIVYRCI